MAVYTSHQCGHCNVYWDILSQGADNPVGPPLVKCRKCNGMNKTSHKLYRDMSSFDKVSFWIKQASSNIFFGLMGLFVGVGFSYKAITDYDELGWIVFIAIIGGISLAYSQFKNLYTTPNQIKNVEKLYDQNGGFLWSDEQYW